MARRVHFFRSLHFKIASGVIATVILSSSFYFLADYRSTERQLFADLQESADKVAGISLQALLQLAMLGRHPQLLQGSLERLAENSDVERIFLMDLEGTIHFSSDPEDLGRQLGRADVGCRDCHFSDKEPLAGSAFIELAGGQYLRNVRLVPNGTQCHACHDSKQANNGVLVIDFPTRGIWAQLRSEVYYTFLRVGSSVLLILAVLGLLLNKQVIQPLQRLQQATAGLGEGIDAAASLSRTDELGELARSFDSMRERVRGSIRKLQGQRAYLQHLINSLNDGLIVLDSQKRIEMTNLAADRIWSAQALDDLLTLPALASVLRRTLESGQATSCEIHLEDSPSADPESPNHRPRFVEINCSPVSSGEEVPGQVILLVRDITRRKRFQAQASRAERLASVGQLAAGLAHEINNPMAAITTCVEGLSRHVANSRGIEESEKKEIRDYLATVAEAAMRCKNITQKLLGASVDEEWVNFEDVNLSEIVQDVITLVSHQARAQRIEIQYQDGNQESSVKGDRQKLSQLILNLLLNSLEASSAGASIQIGLASSEDFLQLTISDTGCGIPENLLEKIFDPFFTTKPAGKGTGLGLSICQWIVRQHGGRLNVQSKPGEGTSFSILFPRISGSAHETTSRLTG